VNPVFSPAQVRVIAGLARGLNSRRIGLILEVSSRCVRQYAARAARRLPATAHPYPALVHQAYLLGHFDEQEFPDLAVTASRSLQMPRELVRALECLAAGMSHDQAAHHLGIGQAESVDYRLRAMRLLGAASPAHAVALAWQHRLFTPHSPR
jgi:DNA-binding CsgD family transcriptional regulator